MNQTKKSSLTIRYVILIGVMLLAANIVLGILLMQQSTSAFKGLIRSNMLSISNTAAGLLDGDMLGALTEEDVGSPAFKKIHEQLTVFQQNADIEYIYTVRQDGEDHFVFIVDADPEDPADFGEEILVTDGLRSAAQGVAKVDDVPAEDEWGNFYSSFSPVYDSSGRIAGIVGIDFDSGWYERQVREHTVSILIISVLFTLMGALTALLIGNRVQRRFLELEKEIVKLSSDVEALTEELMQDPGYREIWHGDVTDETELGNGPEDEISALNARIRVMHHEVKAYLEFSRARANTDALTHVGNTTAYAETQKELEEAISSGNASFSLTVFDINYLKHVNDGFGHARGDMIIQRAALVIAGVYGLKNTYRIGGDEFIAVSDVVSAEELEQMYRELEARVEEANRADTEPGAGLSLSAGTAIYDPAADSSFRDVFVRADETMYRNKEAFHQRS